MDEMPPTYRRRLRVEGATLAGCGAALAVGLLLTFEQARRGPLNTAAQLAVVAGLVGVLAPRSARRSIEEAERADLDCAGSGEPTPLWQLPLVVAGLTAAVTAPATLDLPLSEGAGWDAAVRIGGGCLLVGLGQSVLMARVVARDELMRGRTYFRAPGSRILRGTRLRWTPWIPGADGRPS
jgi:hypothetical protein